MYCEIVSAMQSFFVLYSDKVVLVFRHDNCSLTSKVHPRVAQTPPYRKVAYAFHHNLFKDF